MACDAPTGGIAGVGGFRGLEVCVVAGDMLSKYCKHESELMVE